MKTIAASFTAAGVGAALEVKHGDTFSYSLSGTFSGTAQLESSANLGASWEKLDGIGTLSAGATGTFTNESLDGGRRQYRWRCLTRVSGTLVTAIAETDDIQSIRNNSAGNPLIEYRKNSVKMVAPLNLAAGLELAGSQIAVSASIVLAAGAANAITATITMLDQNGAAVAAVHDIEVFIAEDAAAATGLTADTFSGALTATTGVILTALTAKKHILATTAATGILVLNLVDTGKTADQYFAVKIPMTGQLVVSAASGTSWGA